MRSYLEQIRQRWISIIYPIKKKSIIVNHSIKLERDFCFYLNDTKQALGDKIMDVTFFPPQVNEINMKYALNVTSNRDIKNLVSEFRIWDQSHFGWTNVIHKEQWQYLRELASLVLSKIINPEHRDLQEQVLSLVRPICVEIQKWMDDHWYIDKTRLDIEDCFCWFYEGLIDREETAKALIVNENLSISDRFKLACNYCFMYHVENIWNLMSESEKRRYSEERVLNRIVDFWIKWVTTGAKKGLLLSADSDFDQLCFYTYYTNTVALSYFLQLLTTEDREQYLTKLAQEKCIIPRVMCFCLYKMNSKEKAEMLKKTPFKALKCFLDFPWQSSFLVMASFMWTYLRETDFVHLIYFITFERILPEWDDYNYKELLTEFWLQSPPHFKIFVGNQEIFKVIHFIVGQMITKGHLKTLDLNNFFNGFILPEAIENIYKKACRSC